MGSGHDELVLQNIQFFLAFVGCTQLYRNACVLYDGGALLGKHFQDTYLFSKEKMRMWIGEDKYPKMLLTFLQGKPSEWTYWLLV